MSRTSRHWRPPCAAPGAASPSHVNRAAPRWPEVLRTLPLGDPYGCGSPRRCWCLPVGATTLRRSSSLRYLGRGGAVRLLHRCHLCLPGRRVILIGTVIDIGAHGADGVCPAARFWCVREPDLTFWFDLPPATAAQRLATARTPDRFGVAGRGLFTRVAQGVTGAFRRHRSALPAWMRPQPPRWCGPNCCRCWRSVVGWHRPPCRGRRAGREPGFGQHRCTTALDCRPARTAGPAWPCLAAARPSGLGQFPWLWSWCAWLCANPRQRMAAPAAAPAATPSTGHTHADLACSCETEMLVGRCRKGAGRDRRQEAQASSREIRSIALRKAVEFSQRPAAVVGHKVVLIYPAERDEPHRRQHPARSRPWKSLPATPTCFVRPAAPVAAHHPQLLPGHAAPSNDA